ncbi:E3 ubiquitin-protein ligase DTX3L-like [Arvicola amphibius]|uniref:E3 ubiquitin-protein ligase DTX3L-like n=1 Tax=Arvicola amphibius TaxID=1047088 RepID=UPI001C0A2686|nr:E3 ubiquitin-protein ligase DTX3L-like [Arvicola amphibius]
MASRPCLPSPLLVRLPESISRAHRKLEIYFQSQASGGGECSVQPMGPSAPDTFEVNFIERAAKERVLKKREHQVVIDGKPVTIFLETTKKSVEDLRPSPPSLTQPVETPSSSPPSVTRSLDEALSDERTVYDSDDTIVQEVFLAVTAELNCELLSKEQRAHIASVCPGVRSVKGEDGIAKVCGSFKDIEKIHRFLSVQLLESEQKQKYSMHKHTPYDVEIEPPNQQDLGRGFSSWDPATGLDVSERCFEVYVFFLEYFRRACPGRIESIEKEFGVNIEVQDSAPNMASVHFTTGQPGNLEAACESFIRDYQRCTQALKQDCVFLEDPQRAMELRQELNRCFPKLLIKRQGRKLTFLGSQADISAAAEKVSQTSSKTSMTMYLDYLTGIKIDSSTFFNLLKPALLQEFSEIEQKYNTCGKVQKKTQKTCILLDPKESEVDLFMHSYASFTDAVQRVMCQLTTEILQLKHLGKGRAQLHNTNFFDDLRKKHPYVHFTISQESIVLIGLPNQHTQAKQYMFKRMGLSPSSGERLNTDYMTPISIHSNDSNAASPPLRCSVISSGGLKANKHNFCSNEEWWAVSHHSISLLPEITTSKGSRDCSVIKSPACSSQDPGFNSQQLHGGSQPYVTRSDALVFCSVDPGFNSQQLHGGSQPYVTRSDALVSCSVDPGFNSQQLHGGSQPYVTRSDALVSCSVDPGFNSQQLHGGSQPYVMRSDALVSCSVDPGFNSQQLHGGSQLQAWGSLSASMTSAPPVSQKPVGPVCQTYYGIQKKPEGSTHISILKQSLPGYADCDSIVIQYIIESGIQTNEDPNPGESYPATQCFTYLPDTRVSRKVLDLLREAFSQRLIFTVGDSQVSGESITKHPCLEDQKKPRDFECASSLLLELRLVSANLVVAFLHLRMLSLHLKRSPL